MNYPIRNAIATFLLKSTTIRWLYEVYPPYLQTYSAGFLFPFQDAVKVRLHTFLPKRVKPQKVLLVVYGIVVVVPLLPLTLTLMLGFRVARGLITPLIVYLNKVSDSNRIPITPATYTRIFSECLLLTQIPVYDSLGITPCDSAHMFFNNPDGFKQITATNLAAANLLMTKKYPQVNYAPEDAVLEWELLFEKHPLSRPTLEIPTEEYLKSLEGHVNTYYATKNMRFLSAEEQHQFAQEHLLLARSIRASYTQNTMP